MQLQCDLCKYWHEYNAQDVFTETEQVTSEDVFTYDTVNCKNPDCITTIMLPCSGRQIVALNDTITALCETISALQRRIRNENSNL